MVSKNLIDNYRTAEEYQHLFLQSRQAMEVSPGTLSFYRVKLSRFLAGLDADTAQRQDIEAFLLQFKNPGNRHAYYRAVKTFYNWRAETFGLPSPMKHMRAPKLGKLILPSLTREQVLTLLDMLDNVRDKAIISLFTESGLRLSELASIKPDSIDWANMKKTRLETVVETMKLKRNQVTVPKDIRLRAKQALDRMLAVV